MQQLTEKETEVYMNTKTTAGQVDAGVLLQKADNEYTLILVCANCHHKFNHKFPKGHEAKQLGFGDHHFLRKPDSQYDNIECPKCGCTNINKAWEQ